MGLRSGRISRRTFLQATGSAVPVLASAGSGFGAVNSGPDASASRQAASLGSELRADVVVVGGGLGGCAAALAAARHGWRVILTEETDWIGGQLTQQAVPPDENSWIEQFGATRTYRELRTRIREYYRRHFPLTAEAHARWNLNPGAGSVSLLCHEPRVALAVLTAMLAPYVAGRRVVIMRQTRAMAADADGDRVRAVTVRSASGRTTTLIAPYFVDATELGDLLPLTGTEYVTGAEAQAETGEPHAAKEAQPNNMQAFTCCFAMDYLDGEDHTIDKPAEYDFWREYVPQIKPAWPGRLLHLTMSHPHTCEPRPMEFDPKAGKGLWLYRRIAHHENFVPGTYPWGITLVNWPQNDYLLGNLCEVSEAEAAEHVRRGKQLSLSLLYWLQTEAPRPDGGTGWKGLRLREDVVGTEDGMAKYPYIREARRIRAEFTVLEQHVGTDARMKATGAKREDVVAQWFNDTVGIGSYRIDLHPSTGGDNYIDISSLPFQIPLGAIIPRRVENLLPACKNIGTTHITNGCYRLHPVEWNIGESVGTLVAHCLVSKHLPRQVRADEKRLRDFQNLLRQDGIEIAWPKARPR
ncbi:MAG: FAD-dependent oxidoreductase [Phycisphaerae bacterium]|nr:FAD-dependent oxidoreductase [Phycisphaerae bacterium]